jgi:hypothetical protein
MAAEGSDRLARGAKRAEGRGKGRKRERQENSKNGQLIRVKEAGRTPHSTRETRVVEQAREREREREIERSRASTASLALDLEGLVQYRSIISTRYYLTLAMIILSRDTGGAQLRASRAHHKGGPSGARSRAQPIALLKPVSGIVADLNLAHSGCKEVGLGGKQRLIRGSEQPHCVPSPAPVILLLLIVLFHLIDFAQICR